MALSLVSAMARRRAMPIIGQQQKRSFALGGHHGPPPEWTGVDKIVRSYFPEDYQRTLREDSGFRTGLHLPIRANTANRNFYF
jgi:hypothetical protein